MSTVNQKGEAKRGGQPRTTELVTLTMTAGAAADVAVAIPAGAVMPTFRYLTPTAFSGSPTNIWLSVGKTSGAQDYVSNTDVKALASVTAVTQATSSVADLVSWPAQTIHATLTANGGTNPAGTAYLLVEFTPPAA